MTKVSLSTAWAVAALLALSPSAAIAQNSAANATMNADDTLNTMNATDPALNTMPPATADPYVTTDPALNTMAPATADPYATPMAAPADDDKDFPWGLLGLLGLAGLLGRKRRDDDVRVDRTTDTTNRRM